MHHSGAEAVEFILGIVCLRSLNRLNICDVYASCLSEWVYVAIHTLFS